MMNEWTPERLHRISLKRIGNFPETTPFGSPETTEETHVESSDVTHSVD